MGFDYVTQDAGGRAIMDQAQTSILYRSDSALIQTLWASGSVGGLELFDEIIQLDLPQISLVAVTQRDEAAFRFFATNHKDLWNLPHLRVADLGLHAVVAGVNLYADDRAQPWHIRTT